MPFDTKEVLESLKSLEKEKLDLPKITTKIIEKLNDLLHFKCPNCGADTNPRPYFATIHEEKASLNSTSQTYWCPSCFVCFSLSVKRNPESIARGFKEEIIEALSYDYAVELVQPESYFDDKNILRHPETVPTNVLKSKLEIYKNREDPDAKRIVQACLVELELRSTPNKELEEKSSSSVFSTIKRRLHF